MGRRVAQAPRTLPPRPAQRGLGPRPRGPAGGPSAPGWGCILGPLAQRSWRLPETDSSNFGLTPQRPDKQNWPTHTGVRVASHAQHPTPHLRSPARHVTRTVQCHTTGAHMTPSHVPRLHTTHSTRWAGSPGKAAPVTQAPSTCQPPSCSCGAAPFPCCANKRLLLWALLKKGRLSPGPDGRGSRSRRPNTAALSHPAAGEGQASGVRRSTSPAGFREVHLSSVVSQYSSTPTTLPSSVFSVPRLSKTLFSRF